MAEFIICGLLALFFLVMLIAGFGFLLELILPLPFNGFASGFESLGWIVMFLGGIRAIKNDEKEAD